MITLHCVALFIIMDGVFGVFVALEIREDYLEGRPRRREEDDDAAFKLCRECSQPYLILSYFWKTL